MLPYHLRGPGFGKKGSSNGRDGGGSIQRAIRQDLEALHQQFLADLDEQQQQQQQQRVKKEDEAHSTTKTTKAHHKRQDQHHWKRGRAFGIFKQTFGSFKAALVHLLIPSSKCDDEAYSQLIYAACLDIFKRSMVDDSNNNNNNNNNTATDGDKTTTSSSIVRPEAIAAVFSLYALHQTNPLPSTIDNTNSPWQNLPLGLHSLENPRALYRRAFSQKIRIDPTHYALLLRLRDLSLALRAECHCNQQQQQQQQQYAYDKSDTDNNEKESTTTTTTTTRQSQGWTCKCGMPRDAIDVLDRLEPNLEYCDYTGPVGLEALAGHPEWQDDDEDDDKNVKKARATKNGSGTKLPPSFSLPPLLAQDPKAVDCSKKTPLLATCFQNYQSRIKAIRLPNENSHVATRLRKALSPFYASIDKEPWERVRNRLLGGEARADDTATATANPGSGRITRALQIRTDNMMTMDHYRESSLIGDTTVLEHSSTTRTKADDDIAGDAGRPSFKLVVTQDIPSDMQNHIETAVTALLEQQKDLLTEIMADEVNDHHHHHPTNNNDVMETNTNATNTEKQQPLPPQNGDDVSSIGIGGISVATGQGRAALQALLSSAAGTATTKTNDAKLPRVATILKPTKKQQQRPLMTTTNNSKNQRDPGKLFFSLNQDDIMKSSSPTNDDDGDDDDDSEISNLSFQEDEDDDDEDDDASAATSAVGRHALETLLQKVQTGPTRRLRRPASHTKKRKRPAPPSSPDHQSTVSSVGPGKAALDTLLHKASKRSKNNNSSSSTRRKSVSWQGKKKVPPNSNDDSVKKMEEDAQSITSSVGPGKAALDVLLNKAATTTRQTRTRAAKRKADCKAVEEPKLKDPPLDAGEDNQSTASSIGPGKAALDALLNRANKKRPAPRTQRKAPSSVQQVEKGPLLDSSEDNQSTTSSIGPGRAALDALLGRAKKQGPARTTKKARRNVQTQESKDPAVSPHDEDNQSTSSSVGPGKAALNALLKRAEKKPSRPS